MRHREIERKLSAFSLLNNKKTDAYHVFEITCHEYLYNEIEIIGFRMSRRNHLSFTHNLSKVRSYSFKYFSLSHLQHPSYYMGSLQKGVQ